MTAQKGKPWYESRTMWAGLVEVLIGAGNLALDEALFTGQMASLVVVLIGALKITLRYVTSEPISKGS